MCCFDIESIILRISDFIFAENNRKQMKQIYSLVSALLLLSILACTKDDDMGKSNSNIPNWSVYQFNDQNIGTNNFNINVADDDNLFIIIFFYPLLLVKRIKFLPLTPPAPSALALFQL